MPSNVSNPTEATVNTIVFLIEVQNWSRRARIGNQQPGRTKNSPARIQYEPGLALENR